MPIMNSAILTAQQKKRGRTQRLTQELPDLIGDSSRSGTVVLCALISPFAAERDAIRGLVDPGKFVEISVDTPLDICEIHKVIYQGRLQRD